MKSIEYFVTDTGEAVIPVADDPSLTRAVRSFTQGVSGGGRSAFGLDLAVAVTTVTSISKVGASEYEDPMNKNFLYGQFTVEFIDANRFPEACKTVLGYRLWHQFCV